MSPSPHDTYLRWRITHPIDTSVNSVPAGYRRCLNKSCIVLIAETEQRDFCYGCGGRPNEPRHQGRSTS